MSGAQSYQAGNIDKDRVVYLASDFDNVTRLFLDAAERCIASERREKELQQRLTAADEALDSTKAELAWQESDNAELRKRVGALEGLLRRGKHYGSRPWNRDVEAALKPAEGGGDEA
ncbi:hypothetical protein [Pseudomonas paracarnis]|uniref:hypothetical protein n=1 Tax=Pseudomonas paracarnis TaxID=2750625 RepID=UPI0023DFBD15|nr:hypothetical protein [Pseudomonas paracarnis]MDF3188082.1 hypothetical protein [Pseudomonas paracarnis]